MSFFFFYLFEISFFLSLFVFGDRGARRKDIPPCIYSGLHDGHTLDWTPLLRLGSFPFHV